MTIDRGRSEREQDVRTIRRRLATVDSWKEQTNHGGKCEGGCGESARGGQWHLIKNVGSRWEVRCTADELHPCYPIEFSDYAYEVVAEELAYAARKNKPYDEQTVKRLAWTDRMSDKLRRAVDGLKEWYPDE